MKWISSRRGLVMLLAAVAVFTIALGGWQGWLAQAAPSVVYVNDNDAPADVAGCNAADADTIVEGIAAADTGDTVILCEGTYAGNVTVNKGVTIEGRADASRDEIVIQGSSDGLIIATNDVTIRHLKLAGPGGATTDDGIKINAAIDDTTISDVEASGWNDGIYVNAATDTRIEKSNLHDNNNAGVLLENGGKGNVVQDNDVTKNTNNGVDINAEDEALVEGNRLSDNGLAQMEVVGKSHVRIHSNQIVAGSDGIYIGAVPAEAFIQIGGSADKANIFSGTLGATDYYVNLHCAAQDTVDARYNWWDTATRTEIADRIKNDEDDPADPTPDCAADVDGAVVFHPWLEAEPTPTATATATATATPTPPAGTRDFSLDPAGWHNFVWTGASGTAAADAFSCIADKFGVAYRYTYVGTMPQWQLYVPDRVDLTTLTTVDQYDSMLVQITASGVTCHMPVVTP